MIRTVRIPRGVSRVGSLGVVQAGAGGSAGTYQFDSTGLSSDPRLAFYLQSLTPSQLQAALNGQAPSGQDIGTTDFGHMASCSNPAEYDPTICGPGGPTATNPLDMSGWLPKLPSLSDIPTWGWIAGGGIIAALFLIPRK